MSNNSGVPIYLFYYSVGSALQIALEIVIFTAAVFLFSLEQQQVLRPSLKQLRPKETLIEIYWSLSIAFSSTWMRSFVSRQCFHSLPRVSHFNMCAVSIQGM